MKLLPVFLILLTGVLTFQNNLVQWEYWINPARSEKNCINKEKPALNCKGKCQVAKKIAEQEEGKDGTVPERTKFPEVLPVLTMHPDKQPETEKLNSFSFPLSFPLAEGSLRSVFHPPLEA